MHERVDVNETTRAEAKHYVRACPDKYKREGKVTWMDFKKVARSESKAYGKDDDDDDDDDCDDNDGVKFQFEWLTVDRAVTMEYWDFCSDSVDKEILELRY